MKKCKKMIGVVAMMLVCAFIFTFAGTCEAKAATLTKAEKKQFSKYLEGGIKNVQSSTYYECKKQVIIYNARFYVYDINNDGHKDVIVSGETGSGNMSATEIYMHVDGKYKVIPIRGVLKGVSSKGINSEENSISNMGAVIQSIRKAYKFDKHGNITAEHYCNKEIMYYDVTNQIEYKNGKILANEYKNGSGKKISKATYKKTLKETNKKKNLKMHEVTKENIKKYLK